MAERCTFFCFGPPKSGTTLLQQCLNLHPMISCPSEHHLDYLMSQLKQLFHDYNIGLDITDNRTGGQGATHITLDSVNNIFRSVVSEIVHASAGNKPIAGINDNSLFSSFPLFKHLFPTSKFVAIFRHPIPRAVSAWHHNLQLAEEERDSVHLQALKQVKSYDDWMILLADQFNLSVAHYQNAFANEPNAMAIKFEELVMDKFNVLNRVFRFLGASVDDQITQNIVEATAFEVMKSKARRPHFFRSGNTKPTDQSVSKVVADAVIKRTQESLDFLGY